MKDTREIIEMVKSKTDLIRYPFDEFWFLEGYDLAKEEFLKEIKILQNKIKKCGNLKIQWDSEDECWKSNDSNTIIVLEYIEELKKGVLE